MRLMPLMQFPQVRSNGTGKDTHDVTRLPGTHTLGNGIIGCMQVTRFTGIKTMNLSRPNT